VGHVRSQFPDRIGFEHDGPIVIAEDVIWWPGSGIKRCAADSDVANADDALICEREDTIDRVDDNRRYLPSGPERDRPRLPGDNRISRWRENLCLQRVGKLRHRRNKRDPDRPLIDDLDRIDDHLSDALRAVVAAARLDGLKVCGKVSRIRTDQPVQFSGMRYWYAGRTALRRPS